MEIPILGDLIIILGLSVLVIYLFDRLKLPAIVGFLLTGVIAGPHALSLVNAVHEVEVISEIGVIMLLFVIGMEFSLSTLTKISKYVLTGGGLQVILTIAVVYSGTTQFGLATPEAVFIGFLLSLSSTAIVLQILQKRDELNSPHGKAIMSILIFQDIVVVPMMLFTPMLAGGQMVGSISLIPFMLKVSLVIIMVPLGAKYIVPNILKLLTRTNSRELFIISIVVICFSVAWLTSSIGLSLSLGAFLAGLIISESEYSHHAISNILPFSEIFTSIFFVSIGMLLDIHFFLEHPLAILLITALTLTGKALIAGIAAFFLRLPLRTVILTGLSLSQVGEFSFILSKTGLQYDLISRELYQYFLSVSILTMAATPFIIKYAHQLTALMFKAPIPGKLKRTFSFSKVKDMEIEPRPVYNDHLVIIGFGLNGQNLAKAAKSAEIPYLIIELNADTVEKEKNHDQPIFYGDAVQQGVLEHAYIEKARVVVIAISDPISTRRILANIRQISQTVYVIVRTRYVNQVKELRRLGANEIIPEEFETSIEIFTRVLTKYLIPQHDINKFIQKIRADIYEMLRIPSVTSPSISELNLTGMELGAVRIDSESELANQKIQDAQVRQRFGIIILAIRRNGDFLTSPSPEDVLNSGDTIYIFGTHDQIRNFGTYMSPKK